MMKFQLLPQKRAMKRKKMERTMVSLQIYASQTTKIARTTKLVTSAPRMLTLTKGMSIMVVQSL